MTNNELSTIDLDTLKSVSGGMRWEHLPESNNVEDRRGLSRADSLRQRGTPPPPSEPFVRTPGDLSSQLGLDDIGRRR